MKVALLGDVHANLPALQSVLSHASQCGVSAYWNIGDFVGYGAFPNEVIELLCKVGCTSIIGNYDQKVLRFPKKKAKWRKKKHPLKYLAFKWAYKTLTPANRAYLASLPEERRMVASGERVLLVHGSQASSDEHLTQDTPVERLRELASMAGAEIVVFGHSHQPFARQVDGVWFVNTGSVGRADDGDPRSSYAVLDLSGADIKVEHYRLDYDIERAVKGIRDADLPEAFAQMMLQGYNLDEVISKDIPN